MMCNTPPALLVQEQNQLEQLAARLAKASADTALGRPVEGLVQLLDEASNRVHASAVFIQGR